MVKIRGLRTNLLLLIVFIAAGLLIAAILLSAPMGSVPNPLSLALEGGQYTLSSVGRNNVSMTHFVEDRQEEARDVLTAALTSLESGRGRLAAAGNTGDEYVLRMVENYQIMAESSGVMSEGVENLLSISDDLKSALDHYWRGEFEEASQNASVCLQTLSPLVSDFERWNQSLNDLDYRYVASGQREQTRQAVRQYRSAMETYLQYILLLRSLQEGANYLEMRQLIDEYLRQMQSSIARGDYDAARELIQEISRILQSLGSQNYQNAATTASQLDPNALSGTATEAAQDLKTRLKPTEGIEGLEEYLERLKEYLEALGYLEQAEQAENEGQTDLAQYYRELAEQAASDGLTGLGQGSGQGDEQGTGTGSGQGDPELQNLYQGLTEAFNSLLMRIRGEPEQG